MHLAKSPRHLRSLRIGGILIEQGGGLRSSLGWARKHSAAFVGAREQKGGAQPGGAFALFDSLSQ